MFQVTIKGKTLAEMKENALEIAQIFANANIEGIKEKKVAKTTSAKSALSKKELEAAKAIADSAELERKNELTSSEIEETSAPIEEKIKITKDDVIAEMQKVVEAKNVTASREVLKAFGLNRLSDASEELYPSLIEAFRKAA